MPKAIYEPVTSCFPSIWEILPPPPHNPIFHPVFLLHCHGVFLLFEDEYLNFFFPLSVLCHCFWAAFFSYNRSLLAKYCKKKKFICDISNGKMRKEANFGNTVTILS